MGELKLLTALGKNSELVLELVDFFNGGDRFSYNREATEIRRGFDGRRVRELHLLCTDDVADTFVELKARLAEEYPRIAIHFIPLGCNDVTCVEVDRQVREMIYRETARLAGSRLVIASGGRKMVTQRLIEAGLLYGCAGYLTITAEDGVERSAEVRFQSERFNIVWTSAARFYREKRDRIIRDELGDTFRSLYLLPTRLIERLREVKIGADPAREGEELRWLRRLPKTDLHCHLGGAYDPALLRELAEILLDDCGIGMSERKEIAVCLENRLGHPLPHLDSDLLRALDRGAVHCLANLGKLYEGFADGHVAHAVLVSRLAEEQIMALAADGRDPRQKQGLEWYMKSGDLGGSNLLQSENSLRRAVAWLAEKAAADGVRYIEVRFSPGNYTRAGLEIDRVIDIVRDQGEASAGQHGITMNFLVMATRHKDAAEMKRHVEAALAAWRRDDHHSRVVGFDLAGQEEDHPPELFQDEFEPLHRNFVNVTIHAGEMADDDKIWQAMYRLHAKRIGHGLKLEKNPAMMDYVRDWGVTLEMCPTSNRQTNGFRRFDRDDDGGVYPLKKYLDHGIRVTVNTDNPGISRTTVSREIIAAARMSSGGLSRWDVLRLLRYGFKAAFLPRDEKDQLLKDVDRKIFTLLLAEL